MNALTTFSRLIARACFWPFDVRIVSRSDAASAFRSSPLSRSRIDSAEVDAEAVGRPEAVLELAEDLLVVDDQLRLEVLEQLPGGLEPADGLDRRFAGVVPPRLDVLVHLAHLHQPLDDRVVLLLRDLPVGAQAEVAGDVADRVGIRVGRCLLERLLQQPFAEVACLLQVLDIDRGDESGILLAQLRLRVEQTVDDAVDVLGHRALLRASRLRQLLVQRSKRLPNLDRGGRDRLELARRQLTVLADRGRVHPLADLLRVFG
jgi:hypothetical protein